DLNVARSVIVLPFVDERLGQMHFGLHRSAKGVDRKCGSRYHLHGCLKLPLQRRCLRVFVRTLPSRDACDLRNLRIREIANGKLQPSGTHVEVSMLGQTARWRAILADRDSETIGRDSDWRRSGGGCTAHLVASQAKLT